MKKHPDYILLGATLVLMVLGILILSSVSASLSQEKFGNTYYFLNHQLLFGFLPGLILAFLFFWLPTDFFKKWAPLMLLINLVLVAMVFLPKIGTNLGGATRWLSFGPFSFQPSEFLKLTFILYLASWLASQTSRQRTFSAGRGEKIIGFNQTLIAFLLVVGIISLLLILQPDISTLGVIGVSAILMYFLAGTPFWHSILIVLMGAGGLFALINLVPYRLNRLRVFLNPEADPMGIGYQIKQALIAVGSGGISGVGLGMSMSRLKFGSLPHSVSDAIFAIFAEETGFIGGIILILIFLLFFWRGFRITKLSSNKFSQLAALGITLWITIQGFVNIGSIIGILPIAGVPLPFISYGGSALIAELAGVGILLNISKQSQRG